MNRMERGATLIEVVVFSVVFVIIAGMMYTILAGRGKLDRRTISQIERVKGLQVAMDMIATDLECAYPYATDGGIAFKVVNRGGPDAAGDRILLVRPIPGAGGNIEFVEKTYFLREEEGSGGMTRYLASAVDRDPDGRVSAEGIRSHADLLPLSGQTISLDLKTARAGEHDLSDQDWTGGEGELPARVQVVLTAEDPVADPEHPIQLSRTIHIMSR